MRRVKYVFFGLVLFFSLSLSVSIAGGSTEESQSNFETYDHENDFKIIQSGYKHFTTVE